MNFSASSFATTEASNSSPKPLPLPHRRRDKPQLSCTLCRKRKLKCDRSHPCETCVKRGLSLSCIYVHSSNISDTSSKNQPRNSAYQKLHERIGQLEKLIASQAQDSSAEKVYIQNQAEPGNASNFSSTSSDYRTIEEPLPQEASEVSPHFGCMTVESESTTWVENDHWIAILDGISELKDSLEYTQRYNEHENLSSGVRNVNGPELLLGGNCQISKQEILEAIPQRPIVDRLVSQFVRSVETAPMVLHIPTFLNEYEHFWDHQEHTSLIWISLLFGIMCLAILQQQFGFELKDSQGNTDSRHLAQSYRTKISQCLVLGNYTKPGPYLLESLLLYMHVEYLQSKDTETGHWILLGITVRLALRMGYHRDASQFPRISPFQAEMRRRVWCVIFTMDSGVSAQFGLPRMIRASQTNTAEPRNLLDEDIQEDMGELPSARPESVQTPVQYFVAKNRLIASLSTISEVKTLTPPPRYAEILHLDEDLHRTYDSIPPSLVMRPMTKSIKDDSNIIMQRIYIALTFHKAKCNLHRPYLIPARADERYMYSRKACVGAALEILHIQQILDQETQAGGRLYDHRGKITPIMRGDFLFATTVLSADIDHAIREGSLFVSQNTLSDPLSSKTVIKALQDAYLTWLRSSDSSREASQAARTLTIVLNKVQALNTTSSLVSRGTNAGAPTINNLPDWETFTPASESVVDRIGAVGAVPINANSAILPQYSESDDNSPFDFSHMDFEMGGQWMSETQRDAGVSDFIDESFDSFG